ncbi:MAG: pseudouridine synthase [Myxococcota bacterium]|nr:pseudouridine synthase [Myxococcota bacterium]
MSVPPIPILYQDERYVVIDKPAGILVHKNQRFPREIPILQRLRNQLERYVWPVHRLDRQTSGCLIFALQQDAIEEMAEALRCGTKTYWAFVRGHFPHTTTVEIDTPIKISKKRFAPAHSLVDCLGRSVEPRCSLLRVRPTTGRSHQVRRHVRDLHHPILHDGDHGDSRVNRWWKSEMGLNRLALHAAYIDLIYRGKPLHIHSALPDDLYRIFHTMPWWKHAVEKEPLLAKRTAP